jgi:hypothetical protein
MFNSRNNNHRFYQGSAMKCPVACIRWMAILCLSASSAWAVGETAVITLAFPPGARSTGLGETFTGIADNPEATFYNVAGLGQSPLANSWKVHATPDNAHLTAVASKSRKDFGKKERVWVGTTNGLLRYDGKTWETYDSYMIQDGDDLRGITEKYLNIEDDALLQNAVRTLRRTNKIDANRTALIASILTPALKDSTGAERDARCETLTSAILALEKTDRNSTKIFGIIASKVDSTQADSISEKLVKVFEIDDIEFNELVELKIPFGIAISDSVTALVIDKSERLWIGTGSGLWSYDGISWNRFTTLDGLPSNVINSIALSPSDEILVGTDRGVGFLTEGQWKSFGTADGLPDDNITSVTFAGSDIVYAGTAHGLAMRKNKIWTVLDTTDGLLSRSVFALLYDSERTLWIGGQEGVTMFTETSWKRYRFPESRVSSLAEYSPGQVWIGTNKGAIAYQKGRAKTNADGSLGENLPSWKVFHSKNALKGNNVTGITVHGKDVWVVTDEAVNQYDRADVQVHFMWEPVLPVFGLKDLWHMYISAILPTHEWGTVGLTFNYLALGLNDRYNESGELVGKMRSWEGVFGLCYGLPIKEDLSFGLHAKFINSALAPGFGANGEGVGQTFAVDAAILKRNLFIKNLSLGFQVANMGPSISYISREADPIPFNLRVGLAYQIVQTPVHELLIAADADREFAHRSVGATKPDPFFKALFTDVFVRDSAETWTQQGREVAGEVIGHFGIEYWYVHFIAARLGYMYDNAGSRSEISFGIGLQYGNLAFDWSYISGKNSIARDRQWRTALIVKI